MNLQEIQEQLGKLEGSSESMRAVSRLIDIKTNSDMREVIAEMKTLRADMGSSIEKLDHKLETSIGSLKDSILFTRNEMNISIGSLNSRLETSIGSLNSRLETSIGSLDTKLETKFDSSRNEMKATVSNIRWTISIAITIATIVIGAIGLLSRFVGIK